MSATSPIFDIAAAGMAAQRAQMNIIAENIANANTVSDSRGQPYHARVALFETVPLDGSGEPQDIWPTFAFANALQEARASFTEVDESGSPARVPLTWSPDELGGAQPLLASVQLSGVLEENAQPQWRYDPSNPVAARSGGHKGYGLGALSRRLLNAPRPPAAPSARPRAPIRRGPCR